MPLHLYVRSFRVQSLCQRSLRLALWAIGLLTVPLAAQPEPKATRAQEEITVRSQKQTSSLELVPAAVSVASAEDLSRLNLSKLDDFNGLVPGLTVSKNDGAGRVVSMRGVGWETAQNLSTQPGVLLYVDGVYIANPLAFGLELDDLERVEVFRGPQGTEFGQSAIGGAVNLVTRRPTLGNLDGGVTLGLGSFSRFEGSGYWNLPLGNHAAMRASGKTLDRDGFAAITGGDLDGYPLDDAHAQSARLAVQWLPNDSWSARLSGTLYNSDQHGAAQKNRQDPNAAARQLTQDFSSTFGLSSSRASVLVNGVVSDRLLVQSVSALQQLKKDQSLDGDRLTEDLVTVDLTGFGAANFDLLPIWNNNSRAFSQEVSLLGNSERTSWVAGLYYLKHRNDNFFVELVGPAPVSAFQQQIANPSPTTLPPFQPPLEFVEDREVTRTDSAAYGQLNYPVRPKLTLSFGGRYQIDRATDQTTQFWFLDSQQPTEDNQITWKLGADFALRPDHRLYASLSTGWKNGGLNPGALIGGALDVPIIFAPEEVITAEVGIRSAFANHRAHLNTTAFYSDYSNFQYIQEDPVPFAAGTGNIPKTSIHGLESEFRWQFASGLQVEGQATLLDGSIDSDVVTLDVVDFLDSGVGRFTVAAIPQRQRLRTNLAGNQPPKLVDLSGRVALSRSFQTLQGFWWTPRLDAIYRGEYQYRVFNHPQVDRVPAYTTVSFSLSLGPAGQRWSVSLVASNLFDRDGVNSRFTNPFGLHTTSDELIPPREITARVHFQF